MGELSLRFGSFRHTTWLPISNAVCRLSPKALGQVFFCCVPSIRGMRHAFFLFRAISLLDPLSYPPPLAGFFSLPHIDGHVFVCPAKNSRDRRFELGLPDNLEIGQRFALQVFLSRLRFELSGFGSALVFWIRFLRVATAFDFVSASPFFP